MTTSDSLKPPSTTTSLAISFSSPNLATNTSFSSSSDSDYHENATGGSAKSVITIQNLLDDVGSIDENNDGDESLNLAGENDVEYAELTQRMSFPSASAQKNPTTAHSHQLLENAASEESSDLMLMNLFDATSHHSGSSSSSTALRPIQISSSSVLDNVNETAFHHHGANINSSSIHLPSDGAESGLPATSSSLPHELSRHSTSILSTSPVWKTQVSQNLFLNYFLIIFISIKF